MIPGLKPQYEIRGKVRIGEKKQTSRGKERPAALDYFVSEDDELNLLFGLKPKTIRVVCPYDDAADFFSTGLEFWKGSLLACYSKGEGSPPIAYRRRTIKVKQGSGFVEQPFVTDADECRGEPMGNDRLPITCTFRECAYFKSRDCRPIGRLTFFFDGGRTDEALQLDTKAWNSIERIQGEMAQARLRHGGSLLGVRFDLSVEIEKQGTKQFPVLILKEADVVINSPADVEKADALVALAGKMDRGGYSDAEDPLRPYLAAALDQVMPGWRDRADVVERIKEIGVIEASKNLLEKQLA